VLIPTLAIAAICMVLLFFVHKQGGDAWNVSMQGAGTVASLVPILVFALICSACMEVLIPEEWITHWLGREAGSRGILIGSFVGICMPPGGAVVLYGIVGALMKAGAGIGTLVALTTSYNLLAIHRMPFEISMLGWKFLALRVVCVIVLAPLAGFLAHVLVGSNAGKFFR